MGILLSLPVMATGWIAPVIASCACSGCLALFSKTCSTCQSSIATRLAYALLFLLNSILSWIMMSGWAIKKLEHITLDYMQIECQGGKCYGVLALHRINFALGLLHLLLALALYGVQSTRDKRSKIQNGYWGIKLLLWASLVVLTFLIPNGFFAVWANYFSITGSILFILFGLGLLVDFAHSWAETCLENYEATESKTWQALLVGSTLGMYITAIILTGIMYGFFAASGCSMNQSFITVNLILVLISTVAAIHPLVQEYNPRSGLAQAAMVCLYTTYLTLSAVANEPEEGNAHCNPLLRARGTQTASVVFGALFTFFAIAWSAFRSSSAMSAITGMDEGPIRLDESNSGSVVTSEPGERARMRHDALVAAVESGAIPASALDEEADPEAAFHAGDADDERSGTQYIYSLFHIIFFLATCYTACLITSWKIIKIDDVMGPGGKEDEQFVFIGRDMRVVWVKILSSWVCHGLYVLSCVMPVYHARAG
ncbi:serine incorporator/TMS membrane protein [Protomyces lactucae-debilis]|uniref:Serine incorporator/TMS membrane protein n=1 Tax=Protomyces lactucae-debilis TaxID=2754530 RepID=A0A1Y2FQ98_PROLT|nr:serine incorporator/TMS membrane protein [Protomyces lactucae-debilis]ORY86172.1 serine incorporator/TMS membrane protein [Protomyces lactucae-debilis]